MLVKGFRQLHTRTNFLLVLQTAGLKPIRSCPGKAGFLKEKAKWGMYGEPNSNTSFCQIV